MSEANIHLIEAAPDLLASLQEIKQMLEWFLINAPDSYILDLPRILEFEARMDRANAAIAKARGEPEVR